MQAKQDNTPVRQQASFWRSMFLYAALLALLFFVLRFLQWKLLILNHALELYIGLIALLFTALGVWIAGQLSNKGVKKKEAPVDAPQSVFVKPNDEQLKLHGLSRREYQVLELMAMGFSNAQIAESLFLSVSTIKTHVSNILMKLDAKNRTQAINKGKSLAIIP